MSIGNNKNYKTVAYIRDVILNNEDDIAFIIGNGIHLYCKEVYKQEKDLLSWDKLLLQLWNQNNEKKLNNEDIKHGISYTEIFDIIEINKWKHYTTKCKQDFFDSLKKVPNNSLAQLTMLNAHYDLSQKMQLPTSTQNTPSRGILTANVSLDGFDNIKIKDIEKELGNSLRKHLASYGVDELEDKSDMECFRYAQQLMQDDYLRKSLICNTKFEIAKQMKHWEPNEIITRLVSSIKNLESPLLTTNFDDVFSKSIGAKFHLMQSPDGKSKFTDWYPWNCFYGDEFVSPIFGFGIWHINGMIKYHRSISLGLCDYIRNLERARDMIQGCSIFKCEDFSGKNQDFWRGYNTWLHYIFNKSLFIFGLSLDENEVFLRWLLIQRMKYFSTYSRPHKGWYIAGPKDKISHGKRLFLESAGFEIINIEDYKIIYEEVWQ